MQALVLLLADRNGVLEGALGGAIKGGIIGGLVGVCVWAFGQFQKRGKDKQPDDRQED
ncbi:MAG: hypothetical protein ACKV2Q_22080 [Planctomycetaceae bacterium]